MTHEVHEISAYAAATIGDQQLHILKLQREVRLLNRALGRKKRKINRLIERIDSGEKLITAMQRSINQFMAPNEMVSLGLAKPMTLDEAFAEHEARLVAGVQADPGIEVGGTTHGAGR